MAQIQILRCKNCTSPLPVGVTKCPRCKTEHQFVPEVINPLRCTPAQAFDCKEIFEGMTKANPSDINSLFGMGLVYLGLNNYELAERNFKKAVDQTPGDPDVYYYYALSLFSKRSASLLSDGEAERIEMWLQTAAKIQQKRKYIILQMILRQGAFKGKGKTLAADKEEPEQLLQRAIRTVQEEDELFEIEQHVNINDSRTKNLIEQLRNGGTSTSTSSGHSSDDGGGFEEYLKICQLPKGESDLQTSDDGVARLNDTAERVRFFQGLFRPEKPHYESKPIFFKATIDSLIGFVVALLVYGVFYCIVDWTSMIESSQTITHVEERKSIDHWQHVVDSLSKKRHSNQWDKENAQNICNTQKERLANLLEEDSIFMATHNVKTYKIIPKEKGAKKQKFEGVPSADEIAQAEADKSELIVYSPQKPVWAFIGWALLIGPWLIWAFAVYIDFSATAAERKKIGRDNAKKKEDYESSTYAYNNRPTVAEYIKFCQLFVGPNVGLVTQGDIIAEALRHADIPEGDVVKGKVYLFNCFVNTDEKGQTCKDPRIVLQKMDFEVAVAMPDQLYIITAKWDTTTDKVSDFRCITRKYDSIGGTENYNSKINISSKDGINLLSISIAKNGLGSLFRYQSVDSGNILTYHRTRTTNSTDFCKSLNNMYFK